MAAQENGLTRELGFLEATSIGLGTMIGGGIFILPSIAAAEAGPASAVSFLIGGLVALLSALSHAELATDMQDTEGGGYEYVRRALGPLWASVVGWGMWLGLLFASAFYVVGFARYLTFFVADLPIGLAAATLAVALVGLNYYGAAEASELEAFVVLVLLALILAFVAVGAPNVSAETLRPLNPEGWPAVVATTGTVYVTFIGFGVIATAAAEIEKPERNLPRSMLASVVIPTVLYVLVMYVSTGTLSVEDLADSRIPLADVARQFLGEAGALAMVAGAVLATVSSANASVLSAGRVGFAMAGDRLLPRRFGEINDRFGTPSRTVLATGVGIVALVAVGTGIERLAEVASFVYLIVYGLVHVAVVRLRRGDPDYDPSFAIPDALYPAVPIVGVIATLAVMTQMDLVVVGGGFALIIGAAAWYVVYVDRDDGSRSA